MVKPIKLIFHRLRWSSISKKFPPRKTESHQIQSMVLPHIFSSKSTKLRGKPKTKDKDRDRERDSSCHSDLSPSSSSSSLRQKSSSSSKSSSRHHHHHHSRSSSSTASSSRFSFASNRYSRDPDTHPLNLPPDELRRLSAMAAVRDDQRSSMDIDTPTPAPNGVNGEERSPTPPPHRSSSTPTAADADSFKLAGNKLFKDGQYYAAIQEYNKGW